jgi:hypothetical protein
MKNLLLFTIILICIPFYGQIKTQTCIGFVPEFCNFSIAQNIEINNNFGVFAKVRYGDVRADLFYMKETSICTGISYKVEKGYILFGIGYSNYHHIEDNSPSIDPNRHFIYTPDFGFIINIPGSTKWNFYSYNDVFNWITELGIAYSFTIGNKPKFNINQKEQTL